MAIDTTNKERHQGTFPFMSLSPELRIEVYKFALQDITDVIKSCTLTSKDEYQTYHGALALLHISRLVRLESCEALWPITDAHYLTLEDAAGAAGAGDEATHRLRCMRRVDLMLFFAIPFEVKLSKFGYAATQ